MKPEFLGLILLGSLLTGIFVGFPIAFTLIILAVVFGYIGFGLGVFDLMVFQTLGLMKEETLAAVPLFIFMGHLLEHAGLMERLFISFQSILGGVKGSLYIGVLLTATIFATATGIIGASVTVIGLMSAPLMVKSGYDTRLSAGVITAGGGLGILIPPSVMLVVIGPVVGVSVVKLFVAAIIPGLLLSGLYCGYSLIKCHIWPELGPTVPREERLISIRKILKEFFSGIVPMAFIIFAALGSIIAGLATPTEAAAMAASGALILTIFYRRLNWKVLKEASFKTLQTTSMILFLRSGLYPSRIEHDDCQDHAGPADSSNGDACPSDADHLSSGVAAGMAGHCLYLSPHLPTCDSRIEAGPSLVQHLGGGQPPNGLSFTARGNGCLLPQGSRSPVGSRGYL